jgi:DNA-binding LytR/AlgR family response regulator
MKITVEEIKNQEDVEVVVKCKTRNESVEEIISTLDLLENRITVKKDGRSYLLNPKDIYYFDSVDEKVYSYTAGDVYETGYKLYEVESQLGNSLFMKINKNTIVNLSKLTSFKSSLNGRMEATMKNGEKVEISRNYVPVLKTRLGGGIRK